MLLAGNLNFKFRIVFWNIFFLEIWKTNRTFWKKATFRQCVNLRFCFIKIPPRATYMKKSLTSNKMKQLLWFDDSSLVTTKVYKLLKNLALLWNSFCSFMKRMIIVIIIDMLNLVFLQTWLSIQNYTGPHVG